MTAAERHSLTARRRAVLATVAVGATILAAAAPFAAVRAQVAGFVDVPKGHWAADSIARLVGMGIVQGGPTAAAPFAPSEPSSHKGTPLRFDGEKPVTRYELAVTLYRFVVYIERADKQPKGKLPIKGEPTSGPQAVKTLIAQGYLPKDTPLADNGAAPVTARQFADALSAVIVESRDYATPPSPDSDFSIDRPGDGPNSSS
jgi:hypothetical protein